MPNDDFIKLDRILIEVLGQMFFGLEQTVEKQVKGLLPTEFGLTQFYENMEKAKRIVELEENKVKLQSINLRKLSKLRRKVNLLKYLEKLMKNLESDYYFVRKIAVKVRPAQKDLALKDKEAKELVKVLRRMLKHTENASYLVQDEDNKELLSAHKVRVL